MIRVKELSFGYENRTRTGDGAGARAGGLLFSGVNLEFRPGAMYCLVGPNGCGKSTFVDCILNVNREYSGLIEVAGENVKNIRASVLARRIAYVPQVHERSFPYTVSQIVLMGRTGKNGLSGPGREDEEICRQIIAEMGLEALADRPYTQISGGEMQLVMLARAMAQDTPVIIMDEPTAHLDFRNEMIFLEAAARLVKQKNVTCLMVTHSPDHPFYFEECLEDVRIVAFYDGGIHMCGSPSETMDAGFIRRVFGVEAVVAEIPVPGTAGGAAATIGAGTAGADLQTIRRIIPLRTLGRDTGRSGTG